MPCRWWRIHSQASANWLKMKGAERKPKGRARSTYSWLSQDIPRRWRS